jgi:hypothetical protein
MAVDRRSNALRVVRRHTLIIILALLVPVFISFFVWIAATATGNTSTISYGFPTTADKNGIVWLWTGGPAIPLFLVNIFNLGIDGFAFIVAGLAGFTMVGSLGDLVGGGDE